MVIHLSVIPLSSQHHVMMIYFPLVQRLDDGIFVVLKQKLVRVEYTVDHAVQCITSCGSSNA